MKAAVLHRPGDIRVQEIDIGSLGSDEAFVRVRACGICGSDLPRIREGGAYHYPIICGHEFGGTVMETGDEVSNLSPGQQVSVIPLIPCGKCKPCVARMPFHCTKYDFLGSRSHGGFAEQVKAPGSNVVPVDNSVPGEAVAMAEPVAVACHCIRSANVNPGDTVLVFGAGAIGIFISQWAKISGAGRVIVADIRSDAIGIAEKCGLEAIDVSKTPAWELIKEVTGELGADVVVEAAGAAASMKAAFECVRRRGTVALIGRLGRDFLMEEATLTNILRKEVRVQGVWGFDHWCFPHNDWEVACQAISTGEIIVEPLVTHRYPLLRINEAFEMMISGKEYYCKVLVIP